MLVSVDPSPCHLCLLSSLSLISLWRRGLFAGYPDERLILWIRLPGDNNPEALVKGYVLPSDCSVTSVPGLFQVEERSTDLARRARA